MAAAETAGQLTAVRAVQVALDAGEGIPETATAHDVAATMLSYFKALPRPFFPYSISTVRPSCRIAGSFCQSGTASCDLRPRPVTRWRMLSVALHDAPCFESMHAATGDMRCYLFPAVLPPFLRAGCVRQSAWLV